MRLLLLAGVVVSLAAACGNSRSCEELKDDYSKAFPAALSCDPGAGNQCQQQAMSASECSCETRVQDATELNAIVRRLHAQGCLPAQQIQCPCLPSLPLVCVAKESGGGTCVVQQPSGG